MLDVFIDDFKLSDFGICLTERPAIPTAEREVTYHDGVDDLDGALTEYGALKNRKFDMTCNMLEDISIYGAIRQLRGKLLQKKTFKLSMGDDRDFYYLVKSFDMGDIESEIAGHGEFKIGVVIAPHDYKVNPVTARGTKQVTVTNNGTDTALPIITLAGTGNVTLSVGDYALSIDALNGSVVIDSEKYDYYDPARPTVRVIKLHTKAFPKLAIGRNTITTTGSVTSLSVEFKERYR